MDEKQRGREQTVPGATTATTGGSLAGGVPQGALAQQDQQQEVEAFIAELKSRPAPTRTGARGRLIFAMDATLSRRPTWDMALALQADMFREVAKLGGLDVQLVFFRGYEECKAGKWVSDADSLARQMGGVDCRGGRTQIHKVLRHALAEAERGSVGALVYVGDAMEENADELCHLAGQLALNGTPVFVFQEGYERNAEATFREIARLTRGAFCRFDAGAAARLRDLLAAVAVYAAGGLAALTDLGRRQSGAQLLLEQLKR